MIIQKEDENRIQYLARALHRYFKDNPVGDYSIEYDGSECDGYCLMTDICNEVNVDIP